VRIVEYITNNDFVLVKKLATMQLSHLTPVKPVKLTVVIYQICQRKSND
jgi:hypothetical protein